MKSFIYRGYHCWDIKLRKVNPKENFHKEIWDISYNKTYSFVLHSWRRNTPVQFIIINYTGLDQALNTQLVLEQQETISWKKREYKWKHQKVTNKKQEVPIIDVFKNSSRLVGFASEFLENHKSWLLLHLSELNRSDNLDDVTILRYIHRKCFFKIAEILNKYFLCFFNYDNSHNKEG